MYEVLLGILLVVALGVIGLVMLQQGKGADMGASFGAGASGTLFGSSGSGNFMTRLTAILAAIFFILCLVIGNITVEKTSAGSEWENIQPTNVEKNVAVPKAPAAPNADIPK